MVVDKKIVLVTGATGFIGQHVIERLLTLDHVHIIVTSRTEPTQHQLTRSDKLEFIPYDLSTDPTGNDLFTFFGKPDLLIHLAWQGLPDYNSLAHLHTYWLQHYRFLTNLLEHGLTDLTVTGTCLEYGLQSGCLSEGLATQPTTAYGLAKDTLRKTLELFTANRNVSFKWLRLFYMYGRGQNPRSLPAQLEAAIKRGDTHFAMSKGEQLRDYLSVTDVATTIVQAACQQHVTGVINCCSGQPISVRAFVEQFVQQQHYQLKLNLGYYPYPDYEPLAFWGDSTKLKLITNA